MVRETRLSVDNLVAPLFVTEGEGIREEIGSMPGQHRLSIDRLVEEAMALYELGIPAIDLFPKIPESLKDTEATAAFDPDGLYPRAIRAVKQAVPDLLVMTDAALDPYSAHGHDGIVRDGKIVNERVQSLLPTNANA